MGPQAAAHIHQPRVEHLHRPLGAVAQLRHARLHGGRRRHGAVPLRAQLALEGVDGFPRDFHAGLRLGEPLRELLPEGEGGGFRRRGALLGGGDALRRGLREGLRGLQAVPHRRGGLLRLLLRVGSLLCEGARVVQLALGVRLRERGGEKEMIRESRLQSVREKTS